MPPPQKRPAAASAAEAPEAARRLRVVRLKDLDHSGDTEAESREWEAVCQRGRGGWGFCFLVGDCWVFFFFFNIIFLIWMFF